MFTPKLYIIILHPEKNIRQSMMKAPRSKGHTTAHGAASVMGPATVGAGGGGGGGGGHVNGRSATGIGGRGGGPATTVIGDGTGPPSSGTPNGQL